MSLNIYNTLSGNKEPFEPFEPGKVKMYVCGPTVYDSCHIGHARSVVVFDVIVRYLRAIGYDTTYIRNFTDVDDKIINRANDLGITLKELSEKYIDEFNEDMDALNVRRPDFAPKATEHIDQIIDVIKRLIEKGHAYQVNGDVYYSVNSFEGYGKLSGRKLEDMEAGARVDIDEKKNNPFDFALWKSAKPDEPSWDSPWGEGRPGWHIECSAMGREFLGETFDIHGGGKDMIFPHHENEIAQSEAAFGKQFVRYWVHNGFVNINQEKMSKSLGNFKMIKDVIMKYHPEAVRLFLLSNHYRSPIDFNDKSMDESSAGLDKIYTLLLRVEKSIGSAKDIEPANIYEKFCEAMDDDFNTARGIGIIFDSVRSINRMLDKNTAGALDDNLSVEEKKEIGSAHADILRIGNVLGIITESPEAYFNKKKETALEDKSVDAEMIEEMIKKRFEARKAKDFETADSIRDKLDSLNITLEDSPEGTIWKVKE